jgi:hypothetical protein
MGMKPIPQATVIALTIEERKALEAVRSGPHRAAGGICLRIPVDRDHRFRFIVITQSGPS